MGTVFLIVLQCLELFHLLVFQTFCQYIIGRIRMRSDIFPHLSRIDIKRGAQRIQRWLQILFIIHQHLRVQNNIIDFVADRQNRTVGIQYFTAFKRYCHRIVFKL